ncbi:hypothetical protein [Aminipila terrae]|uniref:hypothetical protein n=1 Tax=Aminipila terrae TaxID=2697030 RepID=UPI00192F41FB|nr:hypothetical protein [Aminipila terrae]
MPTPAKSYEVLVTEGKSHRTKAELNARKNAEESLATGVEIKERPEVANNPIAHKEFLRVNKLLKKIKKNDAIYEPVINRYCMLQAECKDFEEKRESFYNDLQELTEDKDDLISKDEMSLSTYYKHKNAIQSSIINLDRQVQAKRKMILDIEKENLMTIAAALKSIPKKEENKENKILEVLRGGRKQQGV